MNMESKNAGEGAQLSRYREARENNLDQNLNYLAKSITGDELLDLLTIGRVTVISYNESRAIGNYGTNRMIPGYTFTGEVEGVRVVISCESVKEITENGRVRIEVVLKKTT